MDVEADSLRSVDGVLYESRAEAGRLLGLRLEREQLHDVVVLALAHAGVDVAEQVAGVLQAPLDVVCVRKILHPIDRSLVLGAVTADGGLCLRERGGLTDAELTMAAEEARAEVRLLDFRLHSVRSPLGLEGRTAVVVDDGLETGTSMAAALHSAWARGAERVIAAVPVACAEGLATLTGEADDVFCPRPVSELGALAARYRIYPQVSDEEILVMLRKIPADQPT